MGKTTKRQPRLADLYKVKETVEFPISDDEMIAVQVVKLNKVDKDSVLRRANAERARVVAAGKDRESDDYLAAHAAVLEIEDVEALIDVIIMPDLAEALMSVEAELQAEPEWAEDDNLQGLKESWLGVGDEPGLQAVWMETAGTDDPPDEAAQTVLKELGRYQDELTKRLDAAREDLRSSYEGMDLEYLQNLALKVFIKTDGEAAFNTEYLRQRTFYSVRDADDWRSRYFGTLDEFDEVDELIQRRLMETYNAMTVEGVEGKGSRATAASSPSSGPRAEVGATSGSGPEGASPSRTSPTSS